MLRCGRPGVHRKSRDPWLKPKTASLARCDVFVHHQVGSARVWFRTNIWNRAYNGVLVAIYVLLMSKSPNNHSLNSRWFSFTFQTLQLSPSPQQFRCFYPKYIVNPCFYRSSYILIPLHFNQQHYPVSYIKKTMPKSTPSDDHTDVANMSDKQMIYIYSRE